MVPSDFAHLAPVGFRRTLLELGGLHQLNRGRWGLDDKVERLVTVDRDDRWKDLARFILSSSIELLTELHDVHTLGTQGGSHRR